MLPTGGGHGPEPVLSPVGGASAHVELPADFAPLAPFDVHADLRVVRATKGQSAFVIRAEMPEAMCTELVDALLSAGYSVRQAPPQVSRTGMPMHTYYARGLDGAASHAVHASGSVSVAPGVDGGFPLIADGKVRIGRATVWNASIDSSKEIFLESDAVVVGPVVTPGDLVMEEGARVDGKVRAARVRVVPHDKAGNGRGRSALVADPVAVWESLEPVRVAPPLPAAPEPLPSPVAAPAPTVVDEDAHLWDPVAFPGTYRVLAWATPDPAEMPKFLRGRLPPSGPDGVLEMEILEAAGSTVAVLLHPGTKEAVRMAAPMEDLRLDRVAETLLPIRDRLSYLRLTYRKDALVVRASTESVRWLITLVAKMVRIHTRLGRLDEVQVRVTSAGGDLPRVA